LSIVIPARAAAFIPAVVFGALATAYTYGYVEWGPPPDRGPTHSNVSGTMLLVFLWALAATFTIAAIVGKLRAPRP
jgi:hypothetical protein